jgi:ribosomal-protein-alanine N-acetyltransferase
MRAFTDQDGQDVLAWRYPPPYDVYDDWEAGDAAELMDPARRDGVWFAADDASTEIFAGFAELRTKGTVVDVGLGMRPDLTGRGLGVSFITAILAFARDRWAPSAFALDVFPWNERAIRAYERAGFAKGEVYERTFPDGKRATFLRMNRPA